MCNELNDFHEFSGKMRFFWESSVFEFTRSFFITVFAFWIGLSAHLGYSMAA